MGNDHHQRHTAGKAREARDREAADAKDQRRFELARGAVDGVLEELHMIPWTLHRVLTSATGMTPSGL